MTYVPPFVPLASFPFIAILFGALVVAQVALKGLSLWRAAKRDERRWFIAILLVNTLGILELLYLLVFSKRKQAE